METENKQVNINNKNSLNGGFLQSEEWRNFQETVGRKTYRVEETIIIEHRLLVVGKYFYIPRGTIIELDSSTSLGMANIINIARKENIGWIRFDAENEESLNLTKKNTNYKIQKAPHDMQPKEIFAIDITKSEEQLLSEMKQKTRYNIKLAEKKGVKVISERGSVRSKYVEEFFRLVKLTAKRKRINFHPEDYYRKMTETINSDVLSLYVAEYNNKVIAANLIAFYGNTATYLHGATDDEYRNVMAPYLLQWQAILDAKKRGCEFYDFGGVKTANSEQKTVNSKDWSGITKFKVGFSEETKPFEFPGSYDIVINPFKYRLYKIIQKIKSAII
jgi:peptidoglycan pentaglycine glycine transferase (the first glycine)